MRLILVAKLHACSICYGPADTCCGNAAPSPGCLSAQPPPSATTRHTSTLRAWHRAMMITPMSAPASTSTVRKIAPPASARHLTPSLPQQCALHPTPPLVQPGKLCQPGGHAKRASHFDSHLPKTVHQTTQYYQPESQKVHDTASGKNPIMGT